MGRLGHTLSTLRPVGRPARTQDSLPAVGQTLPGGLSVPLGPSERFLRCILHRFPPSPGFPWRKRASVARNLPQPAYMAHRGELSLPGSAGRAPSAATAAGLSDWLHLLALGCCSLRPRPTTAALDGGADVRLAGPVPPAEQGPRAQRALGGGVHQAGHD